MNTPLSWLEEVSHSFACGATAVLCVGSVGDGFPRPLLKELEPPDTLLRWEDIVCDAFVNGELVIIFDVARGFTFPREADRECFTNIRTKAQGAPADDPILQQRAQMATQELPRSAQAAIPIIQQVLSACTHEKPAIPCLLILPDADALCPSSEGTAASCGAAPISLALIQLAGSPLFRAAGHRILMSTPAIQGVDERLRRHDAPFKVVRVTRPLEAERLAFLERITQEDNLQRKIDEEQQTLHTLIATEQERLLKELETHRKTLAALEEDVDRTPEIQAAVAHSQKLMEALSDQKRKEDVRTKSLRSDNENLLYRLRGQAQDPGMGFLRVTPQNWCVIAENGWISSDGGKPARVCKVYADTREISLARLENPNEPQLSSEGEPIRILINSDGSVTRRSSDKPTCKTANCRLSMTYGSAKVIELANKIKALEDAILAIPPSQELEDAQKAHDEAVRACDALREKTRERQMKQCQLLVEKITRLEGEHAEPVTPEITAKREWIKRLVDERDRQGTAPHRFPRPADGIEGIARQCQGLGYRDLLEIFLSAQAEERTVTTEEVLKARITILRRTYGHLIDIVDPSYGFEGIAGLGHIKGYFTHVRDWIHSGDTRRVPMGCLLIGPPGTGKTAVAEAFARECGFLFVKIRNVRTMWVGETERKMEETFAALRSLAPIIVLRDEVDEEDSGRDAFQGDSGVSGRLRRGWMEFLSDPKIRGKIYVISCSNRPDRLDAALVRSGRTDDRIPLLMPDLETLCELFPVMLRRYQYKSDVQDFQDLADLTIGWSGADIEVVVRQAAQFTWEDGREVVNDADLRQAIDGFLPSASQEQIAKMTLAAIKYTSSRRWLPVGYEKIVAHYEQVLKGQADYDGMATPTRKSLPLL